MPPKLGNLTRVQKLSDFFVGKGSSCSSIDELKELSKLKGKLRIWNLQNVVNAQGASRSNLKGKKNLNDLELIWEGDDADDSQQELKVLEGLEPPCTLEHLTVRGYRSTKFPDWLGHCLFSNLVSLRIEGCKNCYEMPSVGHVDSLKTLHISGCDGIVIVGPSFYGSPLSVAFKSLEILHFEGMSNWISWEQQDGAFPSLQELYLSECPKLARALPDELPSLKKLQIRGSDQLVAPFPRAPAGLQVEYKVKNSTVSLSPNSGLKLCSLYHSSFDQVLGDIQQLLGASIADLKQLDIDNCDLGYEGTQSCSPLEGVLEHFKCLDSLRICNCPKVFCFPKCELASPTLTKLQLYGLENLKSLPEQMKSVLPCLVDLTLRSCPELESFPEGGLPSKLESLVIDNCKKLMEGRKQWNLQALPSLSSLTVGCYSFEETESFPEAMLLPPTLTTLFLVWLDGLKSLDYKGLRHLTSLQTLKIWGCNSLEKLLPEEEEEGLLPQSLTTLEINGLPNLKSLSPIHRLPSLRGLSILECNGVGVSEEVALPSTITYLRVYGMKEKSLDVWGLQRLTCLEQLHLDNCSNIESITEEEALPSSLREVELWGCPRLKSIQREGFPSSLEQLHIGHCDNIESITEEEALPSSLRVVELYDCPRLKSIQREGFPSSLERLVIGRCPLLAEKYQWEGEEWHNISYIPHIDIS